MLIFVEEPVSARVTTIATVILIIVSIVTRTARFHEPPIFGARMLVFVEVATTIRRAARIPTTVVNLVIAGATTRETAFAVTPIAVVHRRVASVVLLIATGPRTSVVVACPGGTIVTIITETTVMVRITDAPTAVRIARVTVWHSSNP